MDAFKQGKSSKPKVFERRKSVKIGFKVEIAFWQISRYPNEQEKK